MGIFALIITLAVCITMTFFILKKPVLNFKFITIRGKSLQLDSYWIIALLAPILILCFKILSPAEIYNGITAKTSINPVKILILFFSMCFMSVCLDKAGFFEFCAVKALAKAKNGQKTLFTFFYFFIGLLTIFTSNDIIILAFTPFICYFCKSAKISVVPYIAAEFAAANTWSLMLIIGNPTNIYIASSLNITFIEYFKVMALPTIVAGLSAFFVLKLIFNKTLSDNSQIVSKHQQAVLKDKTAAIFAIIFLGICIVFMSIGSYINLDMWLISLIFALCLLVSILILQLVRKLKNNTVYLEQKLLRTTFKGLPFNVIPFLLSMFTAVLALTTHGITAELANILIGGSAGNTATAFSFGIISTLASNVLNNIPMSVLFSGILQASGSQSVIYATYATIIGSNIGAFISPSGALAGIMLLNLLKGKDTNFNTMSFIKYLAPAAILSLLLSVGTLVIVLNIF